MRYLADWEYRSDWLNEIFLLLLKYVHLHDWGNWFVPYRTNAETEAPHVLLKHGVANYRGSLDQRLPGDHWHEPLPRNSKQHIYIKFKYYNFIIDKHNKNVINGMQIYLIEMKFYI